MDDQVVRVIIADDHPVARKGVLSLLSASPGVEVIAEASNGAEVLALYAKLRPRVVITDLRMPVLDGVALTRALLAIDPNASVLIFTHYDGDEQVLQALRAGARGYLTKDAEGEVLLQAITTLARGGRFIPAELAGRYAELVSKPSLSPRERETLAFMAQGLTNHEIAERLKLSERTAAMHVGNVLSKLGAKTRT
ncbi:MAG: response regulator transcription factor, partial [Deltaproteobacteria bacterium]|nr:response regulator transcription factor [Deltaproteobacteria bacterium]